MKHISLETAKALRDAGFPQDGCAFFHVDEQNGPEIRYHPVATPFTAEVLAAAPTTDEFLELLPKVLHQNGFPRFLNVEHQQKWSAGYLRGTEFMVYEQGDSPAEALAQLWLETQGKDGTE